MITELKDDLLTLPIEDIYNKYLLGQNVWLFLNDGKKGDAYEKYDELKYYISKQLDVHFNNIAIVGSAKTGISFSPKKKLKPFNTESDLDIVLVSQKHYSKFWNAYLEMFYRGVTIPEYDFVNKSIFKGFISIKNPTEKHPDIKEWVKISNSFIKDFQMFFGIERDINYRIYSSWEAVQSYHFFGIKQLKNYIENNNEKEQLVLQLLKGLIINKEKQHAYNK